MNFANESLFLFSQLKAVSCCCFQFVGRRAVLSFEYTKKSILGVRCVSGPGPSRRYSVLISGDSSLSSFQGLVQKTQDSAVFAAALLKSNGISGSVASLIQFEHP